MKKALFLITILLAPFWAHGQVMFTEVMYDLEGTDTGREWVEVYNAGSSGVDLGDWKLFEGSTNHRLTASGATVVPAQGFAIIADNTAKFLEDNLGFSGILFDSTFSLSNDGETLVLRDGSGADIDTVSYSSSLGAQGDGSSLQKNGSGWIAAVPTPGLMTPDSAQTANQGEASTTTPDSQSPSSSGGSSSHSSQVMANVSFDEPILEVSSGRDRLGFVGAPLSFEARVKKSRDVVIGYIHHAWSMGDGSQESGQFVSHTYLYPGDYIVVLNSDSGSAQAVSKIRVKIVEPAVSVVAVTPDFIEIQNRGAYELNLGKWVLETTGARFVIPQDTLIASFSSVKLPTRTTKLDRHPGSTIRLINPSGATLAEQMASGGDRLADINTPAGEQVVAIPEALTLDIVRSRLIAALGSEGGPVEMRDQSPHVAGVPAVEDKAKKNPTSTPETMAASVIYTVDSAK
ncbi:MAG: lamin tail domain-containing protein, partial [Candidatus Paceibacterota bacterium]